DADGVALAFPADPLLVPVAADLVTWRHLPRDTAADVLPCAIGESGLVLNRCIQPFRRIAGVGVGELLGVHARASLGARRREVPQAILEDRSADRAIHVIDLRERRRRGDFAAGVV